MYLKNTLLFSLLIFFTINCFPQKVVIKVNPLTCISCLGGIGHIIDDTSKTFELVLPERLSKNDAPDFIQKILNIDPADIKYTISDSIYYSISRNNNESELYFYGSDGHELSYLQIGNCLKRKNCFDFKVDSLTENCNAKYLSVNRFAFLDSLLYILDRSYGHMQEVNLSNKKCIGLLSFDSISVAEIYSCLKLDFSDLENYNKYLNTLKKYNRDAIFINSIFSFNQKLLSSIGVPLVKTNDTGTIMLSGISTIA